MALRIIGCGTVGRGDDEAGLLVARRLREMGIDAVEHDRDGLDLIESWRGADAVILIDAVVTGAAPRTIAVIDGRRTRIAADSPGCSTHAIGIAQALDLARSIGRLPARLLVYGIEGRQCGFGSTASPEVIAACRRVALRISRQCRARYTLSGVGCSQGEQ